MTLLQCLAIVMPHWIFPDFCSDFLCNKSSSVAEISMANSKISLYSRNCNIFSTGWGKDTEITSIVLIRLLCLESRPYHNTVLKYIMKWFRKEKRAKELRGGERLNRTNMLGTRQKLWMWSDSSTKESLLWVPKETAWTVSITQWKVVLHKVPNDCKKANVASIQRRTRKKQGSMK